MPSAKTPITQVYKCIKHSCTGVDLRRVWCHGFFVVCDFTQMNLDWIWWINRSLNLFVWLWRHWPFVTLRNSCLMPSVGSVDLIHHDDVIKRRHFLRYWPFVRGIYRWPVNSSHKGQWRGALICAWINGSVNNREAGIWDAIVPIMTSQ